MITLNSLKFDKYKELISLISLISFQKDKKDALQNGSKKTHKKSVFFTAIVKKISLVSLVYIDDTKDTNFFYNYFGDINE